MDFKASLGVAIREYQADIGPAGYALFVGKQAIDIVEAKPDAWRVPEASSSHRRHQRLNRSASISKLLDASKIL